MSESEDIGMKSHALFRALGEIIGDLLLAISVVIVSGFVFHGVWFFAKIGWTAFGLWR